MQGAFRSWPLIGREETVKSFRNSLVNPACSAFVLFGQPGAGKTRVAEECLRIAKKDGFVTGKAARAQPEDRPLTSLAHIVPKSFDSANSVEAFNSAILAIQARANKKRHGRPYVLLIDPLSELDYGSAALVDQLLQSGSIFLLGVLENGHQISDTVSTIVRDDSTVRAEVPLLTYSETEELLSAVLEGPIEPYSLQKIYHTTEGNALYLREFLIGAINADQLRFDGETWSVSPTYRARGHLLEDLVAQHLAGLSQRCREVLEIIVVCGTIGCDQFSDEVSELESAGLVSTHKSGRRYSAALAHPVYGQILSSACGEWRAKDILLRQCAAVRNTGARRHEDIVRLAQWELAARGQADASLLTKAARSARTDRNFAAVCELASAAVSGTSSYLPRMLLGEALYERGHIHEGYDLLRDAFRLASNDEERVYASMVTARLIAWSTADVAAALEMNAADCSAVETPEAKESLRAVRGVLLLTAGKPKEALQLLDDIDRIPNQFVRAVGHGARAASLTATGNVSRGLKDAYSAYEERSRLPHELALPHLTQYLPPIIFGLQESGKLEAAYETARRAWSDASDDEDLEAMAWAASNVARCALLRGHPRTALVWASQAAGLSKRLSLKQTLLQSLVQVSEAASLIGRSSTARRALDEAAGIREVGPFLSEYCLGEAWYEASQGNRDTARNILLTGADNARHAFHVASEARILTDLCRIGDEAGAWARYSHLHQESDGELISLRAQFIEGQYLKDPEKLMTAATGLGNAGADLLAAEAAEMASAIWGVESSRKSGMAHTAAVSFMSRCEGARTVGTVDYSASALTAREKEISALAASGMTSGEIADRLTLSQRTVDNHLQNVYRKLGITSRKDIHRALRRWS